MTNTGPGTPAAANAARLASFVIAGYADNQERTPWKRCPVSYEDWRAGANDTPEVLAYWSGWDAANNDAFAKASR